MRGGVAILVGSKGSQNTAKPSVLCKNGDDSFSFMDVESGLEDLRCG
jgi:hypothetical protein